MFSNKINKVLFDIEYPNQTEAYSMQNKLISDFNGQLHRITEKLINSYFKNDNYRIERIEIDLGIISKHDFETILPTLYKNALEEYFFRLLNTLPNLKKSEHILEKVDLSIEIFEYLKSYLTTGIIPWNLQELNSKELTYWFIKLGELSSNKCNELLLLLKSDIILNRFINTIPFSVSNKVYSALLPIKTYKNISILYFGIEYIYKNMETHTRVPIFDKNTIDKIIISFASNHNYELSNISSEEELIKIFSNFILQTNKTFTNHLAETIILTPVESSYSNAIANKIIAQTKQNITNKIYGNIEYDFNIESHSLVAINKKYFDVFLKNNFPKYQNNFNNIKNAILNTLSKYLHINEIDKLEAKICAVLLESIKTLKYNFDPVEWKRILIQELYYSFNISIVNNLLAEKEINKLFEQLNESFYPGIKYDNSTTLNTIKPQKSDFLKLEQKKSGNNNNQANKSDIQQTHYSQYSGFLPSDVYEIDKHKLFIPESLAFKYLELLLLNGKDIFNSLPVQVIESLHLWIDWLSKKNPRVFESKVKELSLRITPIIIWEFKNIAYPNNEHTIKNQSILTDIILRNTLPKSYSSFGEVLFYEILNKGFLPTTLFYNYKYEYIYAEFLNYVLTNFNECMTKLLYQKHSNYSISYIYSLLNVELENSNNIRTKIDNIIIGQYYHLFTDNNNEDNSNSSTINTQENIIKNENFSNKTNTNDYNFTNELFENTEKTNNDEADIEKKPYSKLNEHIEKNTSKYKEKNLSQINSVKKTNIKKLVDLFTDFNYSDYNENELKNIAGFQLLLDKFISDNLSDIEKDYFISYIIKLIDLKNHDFAVTILALPDVLFTQLKKYLPKEYCLKIDSLKKSFLSRYMPSEIISNSNTENKPFIINEGTPIYIQNSGIVILNPYLKMLFDRLELLENNEFKTSAHITKAIQIIHYLCTNQTNPKEHETVFNKILTGLDPEMPMGILQEISDKEKEMCDGLLNAVIKNWGALKNTSIETLRASFFLRNGSLTKSDKVWTLKIEQSSIDVLIDKLPWSFTTTKYNWMKLPVITEWR